MILIAFKNDDLVKSNTTSLEHLYIQLQEQHWHTFYPQYAINSSASNPQQPVLVYGHPKSWESRPNLRRTLSTSREPLVLWIKCDFVEARVFLSRWLLSHGSEVFGLFELFLEVLLRWEVCLSIGISILRMIRNPEPWM